jgi:hypothetical protein
MRVVSGIIGLIVLLLTKACPPENHRDDVSEVEGAD